LELKFARLRGEREDTAENYPDEIREFTVGNKDDVAMVDESID